MPQLNIHLTPEFEEALTESMRLRRVRSRSEAVRLAIEEAVERERRQPDRARLLSLAGNGEAGSRESQAAVPLDDDLWLKRA